jgi:predicted DsbA family dithiol-disulfide isomerase
MTIHVDVWSDFVCPWCYLANGSLNQLKQTHDVEIEWHSYELRPAGSPPMPPEYRARIEAAQPMLRQQAKEDFGLTINSGPFGIDSRPALIGEKYAQTVGKGSEYHDLVHAAYWRDAQDISDLAVLKDLAVQAGLDADAFEAALNDPAYDQLVEEDVQQAYEFGLSGVPAMIFDNKYLVSGAQPHPVLVNVVEKITAQTVR